eukprot:UN10233
MDIMNFHNQYEPSPDQSILIRDILPHRAARRGFS